MEAFISHFNFTTAELAVHIALLVFNFFLLFFARPIFEHVIKKSPDSFGYSFFHFINISFLVLHIADLTLLYFDLHFEHFFLRFALTIITIYTAFFSFSMISLFTRKKFGFMKKVDDKEYYIDTYNSRLIDILSLVLIIILALYSIINIWGWTSLLEATGIFGLIAAFLALTNQIWAPDLYYGLVILNSNMIDDGDVIMMQGSQDEFIISKVTFIYTILLDVRNNHRTIIRNAKFIESKIDNLSKRASHDGIRIKLIYKIGYAQNPEDAENYHKSIKKMFEEVNEICLNDDEIKINQNVPFELLLHDTGDFALEYHLFFYLVELPETKVTKTIRSIVSKTPKLINEKVLLTSYKYGIDLDTPIVINSHGSIQ